MVAIAASTGGVEAIQRIVTGFPGDCPPTLIVQHMPCGITPLFADRLDRHSLMYALAAHDALQTQAAHEPGDGASGDLEALTLHLPPDLPGPVDAEVLGEDAADLRDQHGVAAFPRR